MAGVEELMRNLSMGHENQAERSDEAIKGSTQDVDNFTTLNQREILDLENFSGSRVKVCGLIHQIRRQSLQGKKIIFITVRIGTCRLNCVLDGLLCMTPEADILGKDCCVELFGTLTSVGEEKKAPGNHELRLDGWVLLGGAPASGIEAVVTDKSHDDHKSDMGHLMMHGENTVQAGMLQAALVTEIREHYDRHRFVEVFIPPTFELVQAEGSSAVFSVDYFKQKVFLSQSIQLYLETAIATLGYVYCIGKSFRAEQNGTRRHLSEFLHCEAEIPFISFDELLAHLENLLVDVCEKLMASEHAGSILKLNPEFKVPKKPFRRMNYSDAIIYLKEYGITKSKEDKSFFVYGEDISESAKIKLVDKINEPIFLCRFPAGLKASYMKKCPEDRNLTQSVDLSMPGVGEIAYGSMRIDDEQELQAAFTAAGYDSNDYYWYLEQRIYGSCPHGGYGIGIERLLCWIINRKHVREVGLPSSAV